MKRHFLLLVISLVVAEGLSAQKFYSIVGKPFPSFVMTDIDDSIVSNATLLGKPTLLIFFGTRCPPCMKELKELDESIPDSWYESFNIYAIGSTDDSGRLQRFNSRSNYKFNFIPDPNQELFNKIGDHTIPRTFLLDRKGNIKSQTVGFNKTPFENLMKAMRGLI